ncbi:helix-turn-helix domain-containing protein [Streptomyces sp. NPDC059396]|uniref:helix-turn-helix domain-containing protein n=1 Tax=Streptomyces sp. NPDC059396 TaxID=3346819 RepID=UPI003696B792
MTTGQSDPGDHPHGAAEDTAHEGEDLGALITRALSDVDRTQKELATAAGVPYTTLNHWIAGRRGTSRVDPEIFRGVAQVLRGWGATVTVREIFAAVGRVVPGPSDQEREERLLRIYRALSTDRQRDLIQIAEAMGRPTVT